MTPAFPDKSPAELTRLVKAFYRHQADLTFEIVKGHSMDPEEIKRRVVYTNLTEALGPYQEKNQPVLLMAGHHWNWEWLLLSGQLTSPLPITTLYKPLHSESAEQFMYETRSRYGGVPIPNKKAVKEILKRKASAEGYVFAADQAPSRRDPHIWTQFMQRDSIFHTGFERLARVTRYPVFFVKMKQLRRGYYEATLIPMAEPPYPKEGHALCARYIEELEKSIYEQPAGWLWSNRRWKKSQRPKDQPLVDLSVEQP